MNSSPSILAAAAFAWAAGCASPPPSPPPTAAPVSVTIDRAATTTVPEVIEAGGVVRARLTATIASRVMASVATVHVKTGDRVRQGAALVTLDARELTANAGRAAAAVAESGAGVRASDADVRAADSALRLARASYDRVKSLHDSRSATAQELDEATTALSGAEARVSGAQAHAAGADAARTAAEAAQRAADVAASYAVLTAPFDGAVAERFVDPGALASPGIPLLVLEDPSGLRLEVQLDEARAAAVRVGQDVDTLLDTSSRPDWCTSRVAEIGHVNQASHNFLIKIDLAPDPAARTGVFGRARLAGGSHRAVTVPDASLVRRGQLTFVFIVTPDGRARLRPIVIGAAQHGRTEVLAGLADGDAVITTPPASLTDGAPVDGRRR